jgi:hypothetical protein
MWVKKTPEEIANSSIKKRRTAIKVSAFVIVVSTAYISFIQRMGTRVFIANFEEALKVMPVALIFGFIFGAISYLGFRRDLTLFCPSCEQTYKGGFHNACSCGSSLEPLRHYKWSE